MDSGRRVTANRLRQSRRSQQVRAMHPQSLVMQGPLNVSQEFWHRWRTFQPATERY